MQELVSYFSEHTGVLLQGIVLLCVNFVFYYVKGTAVAIRDLQRDIKEQNEKFKDYVNNEKCEYHRKLIESHMNRTDARLAEFAKQCKQKCRNTCKNNKTENI